MTNAEARRYILENWFDGDENVDAVVGGDTETTAMKCAVKALERADEFEKKSTSTTNADKIRAMTDDDLCVFLLGHGCPPCYIEQEDPCKCGIMRIKHYRECSECWMAWLQKEADLHGLDLPGVLKWLREEVE